MIWRTLNELSPSSTTSPSVLSTPPWSQEQWLRGLPLSQFPLSIPRVNFKTFLVYSVFNVIIYAIPASWLFSQDGWLKQLGGIDYGCGVVDPTQFLKNLSSSILSFALNRWCIWLVAHQWWVLCFGCHHVPWTQVIPPGMSRTQPCLKQDPSFPFPWFQDWTAAQHRDSGYGKPNILLSGPLHHLASS